METFGATPTRPLRPSAHSFNFARRSFSPIISVVSEISLLLLLSVLLLLEINDESIGRASFLSIGTVEAAFNFDLNEMPQDDNDDDDDEPTNELNQLLQRRQNANDLGNDSSGPMEGVEYHTKGTRRPVGLTGDTLMSEAQHEPEQTQVSPSGLSKVSGLWNSFKRKLPQYFDFGQFVKKFQRRYATPIESQLRRSIFVSRCIEIFKSRVAYRMGKSSYMQSVNKFSDQTRDELSLMFMPAPPPEHFAASTAAEAAAAAATTTTTTTTTKTSSGRAEEESRRFIEELSERKRQLKERERNVNRFERTSAMMEIDTQGTDARSFDERARQELERFFLQEESQLFDNEQEESMERALREELAGVNVETFTQFSGNSGQQKHNLPWPGQLKSTQLDNDDRMDLDYGDDQRQPVAMLIDPVELPASLDWSQHECFHEIYDQGKGCGKCYVMASTSLAEFYKCTETGPGGPLTRRKFSKEFVLYCAQKFSPKIMGCAGGSPLETIRFIAYAGIFNIRDWRQTRQTQLKLVSRTFLNDELNLRCPLSETTSALESWGPVRVLMNPKAVRASEWLSALQDGPLVATVQMPTEGYESYANGVHNGLGCQTSGNWHAMILVGYGQSERGERFWRFRNSFGPDWGDAGHFNLAMDVPSACLAGAVRVYREPLAR